MRARSGIIPFIFAVTLGGFLPAAAAEKKREPPPPPPALPVPQEIQVLRGEEREIFLRVYGRKNQPISFVIRRQPRSGKLSQPVNTEAEVASVKYRPPDDRKITSDTFLYAARSTEGVSAAVEVDIKIVDIPALLAVQQEVTFAPRLAGTEETQVIEIENQGGNTAEGEAFVDPPWKIDGDSNYRIEAKGRGFLRVKFAPVKSGKFSGEIRYSSQSDRTTALRGTAMDAIAVNPPLLTLQPELTTLVRAGAVQLTNHTDSPLTVRASATGPLRVDSEIMLAAGETRPFIVRTAPGEAAQVTGKVIFEAGAYRSDLPVSAETLPAVIRSVESIVNFGQVPAGPNPQFEVALQNLGGRSGTATLTATAPLRAPTEPISLAPGQIVPVQIGIAPETKGMINAELEIKTGTTATRIPVRGGVGVTIPRLASPPATSPGSRKKTTTSSSPSEPREWSPYETDIQKPVDATRIVRVVALEPKKCSLEWRKEMSKASRFTAEMRHLGFSDGQLVEKWVPHPAFRVEKLNEHFRGTFESIEPGRLYTIRVREQEQGKPPGEIVFQSAFSTPVPQNSAKRFGWKWILIAAGCGWVVYFLWKRRQSRTPPPAKFDARKTQKIFD